MPNRSKSKTRSSSKNKSKSHSKVNKTGKTSQTNKINNKVNGKVNNKINKANQIGNMSSVKDKSQLKYELTHLMGIGAQKADKLISDGLTNIQQLKSKKWSALLPEETKLFIKLKPIDKIPHDDIKTYVEPIINTLRLGDDIKTQFAGSYRRQKPISSDIDIMVVSDNNDALNTFVNVLKTKVKAYPYSHGDDKVSIIIVINPKRIYKIDAFRANREESIPMLLYSTGSKEFNIRMRAVAKKKEYMLNQRGLYKNGVRVNGLTSERDYFDILGMTYLEPNQR